MGQTDRDTQAVMFGHREPLPFALSTVALGTGPGVVPGVPEQGWARSPAGSRLGREAAGNVDPVDLLWVISPDYFTAAC